MCALSLPVPADPRELNISEKGVCGNFARLGLCRLTSTKTLNLRDTMLPLLESRPKTRHATQGQRQKVRHAKAEINQ
jgi:hypothetical protein